MNIYLESRTCQAFSCSLACPARPAPIIVGVELPAICIPLKGKLIVSCQARPQSPFRDSQCMARFALAAVQGGAAGIRADGPDDVRAIRAVVRVPIVGIQKLTPADGRILITPTFEGACRLAEAGADVIALDCTTRGQRYGAFDRLRRIRSELGVPVMADIATLPEAQAAAEAGADLVGSTLRGYTPETETATAFDPRFITDLVSNLAAPVVAEGWITTPTEAAAAITAGAFAVVVGSAITRPEDITRRFTLGIIGAARPA